MLLVGFKMEPHLDLLAWALVEVSFFLESPNTCRIRVDGMFDLAQVQNCRPFGRAWRSETWMLIEHVSCYRGSMVWVSSLVLL